MGSIGGSEEIWRQSPRGVLLPLAMAFTERHVLLAYKGGMCSRNGLSRLRLSRIPLQSLY